MADADDATPSHASMAANAAVRTLFLEPSTAPVITADFPPIA
jgi:hypothetical protein